MNENFYIVLPSNSIKSNTPSDFVTNFATPFSIANPKEWEVGMKEIHFKNSIKTIHEDKAIIYEIFAYERDTITNIEGDFRNDLTTVFITTDILGYAWFSPSSDIPIVDWKTMEASNSPMLALDDAIVFYSNNDTRMIIENKTKFTAHVTIPEVIFKRWGFDDHIGKNVESGGNRTLKLLALEKKTAPYEAYRLEASGKTYICYKPKDPILQTSEVTSGPIKYLNNNQQNIIPVTYGFSVRFEPYTITVKVTEIVLTPGAYLDPKDLEEEMNKNETFNENFKFSYDQLMNRFEMKSMPQNKKLELHLVNGLNVVLGFTSKVLKPSETIQKGEMEVDLMRGINSLFIHSDIVQPIYVGDSMAPLLRQVSFNVEQYGEMIHINFMKPIYLNLNKNYFDKIEIYIYNAVGVLVPFVEGLTTVVLHFQRKK